METVCRRHPLLLLLLLTLPALHGCGSDPGPLVVVHGTVYFRGKPLAGGCIVFVPDELRGNEGEMAQAEIGPDGTFTLRTGERTGIAAGWYRVSIAGPPQVPGALTPGIPDHFCDPERSGISREVKVGRDQIIDLHLE